MKIFRIFMKKIPFHTSDEVFKWFWHSTDTTTQSRFNLKISIDNINQGYLPL